MHVDSLRNTCCEAARQRPALNFVKRTSRNHVFRPVVAHAKYSGKARMRHLHWHWCCQWWRLRWRGGEHRKSRYSAAPWHEYAPLHQLSAQRLRG